MLVQGHKGQWKGGLESNAFIVEENLCATPHMGIIVHWDTCVKNWGPEDRSPSPVRLQFVKPRIYKRALNGVWCQQKTLLFSSAWNWSSHLCFLCVSFFFFFAAWNFNRPVQFSIWKRSPQKWRPEFWPEVTGNKIKQAVHFLAHRRCHFFKSFPRWPNYAHITFDQRGLEKHAQCVFFKMVNQLVFPLRIFFPWYLTSN